MARKPCFLYAVSAGLILLAAALTFPAAFGFSKSARVAGIVNAGGFLLSAELPRGLCRPDRRAFLFPDHPVLYEGGLALARPLSSTREITNAGRGRCRFRGSEIQFSTSDGGPPDGREYVVRAPLWSVKEPWLVAVWAAALLACAVALQIRRPGGLEGFATSRAASLGLLGASVSLAAGFVFFGPQISDAFFTGLTAPAAWALLMGWCAVQRRAAGRAALFLMALPPALAGYFYYAVSAASDSSFLVAGVIPWSDARMHFLQSAGIALDGSTGIMFNGRFLYPAFEAVALAAAGLNLPVANLLVSILVMVALAFPCRAVAARTGAAGASLFCLLVWLYFRAHGCGLVMTENLGLLLGLLGFAFLLLSVDLGKTWPVFASIAFFSLGSAARPGALFVLPALALYAGIRVWKSSGGRMRPARAAAACALALALTAACFASNQVLLKTFHSGEGRSFGNFAFTLHGLLNGTKWSTSYDATNGDAELVMRQNICRLKESPGSLLIGIRRAYAETLKDGFLFRFGRERRLAHTGMILFALGALACGFLPPLRRDALWIALLFAGIVASVPFAPPWDAEVRPYAVTVAVQCFLAAAGLALVIAALQQAARLLASGASPTQKPRVEQPSRLLAPENVNNPDRRSTFQNGSTIPVRALAGFAALCLALLFPAPLILKLAGPRRAAAGPVFHAGSLLHVSNRSASGAWVSPPAFLDRLSDFQAQSPDAARIFLSANPDFVLAINWSTLQAVLLRSPLPDTLPRLSDTGGLLVDPAALQEARSP